MSYGVLTDCERWLFWKWDGKDFYRSETFSLKLERDKIFGILLYLTKEALEQQLDLKARASSTAEEQIKRKLSFSDATSQEINNSSRKREKTKNSSPDTTKTPNAKRTKSRRNRSHGDTESELSSSFSSEDSVADDEFVEDTSPQRSKKLPLRSRSNKENPKDQQVLKKRKKQLDESKQSKHKQTKEKSKSERSFTSKKSEKNEEEGQKSEELSFEIHISKMNTEGAQIIKNTL